MNIRGLWLVPVVLSATVVLASCGTAAAPESSPSVSAVAAAPTYVEVDDRTPQEQLVDAVKTDDVALAETALAAGADVNGQMDDGNFPITIAVTRDSLEMVDFLIANGAALVADDTGFTVLEVAGQFAGAEVTQAMLDAGLDPNGVEPRMGMPLSSAAFAGNAAVTQVLIDAGADVNIVLPPPGGNAPGGFTPIFSAAYGGDLETVQVLVDAGADYLATSEAGDTAADWAQSAHNDDIYAYLTELGG